MKKSNYVANWNNEPSELELIQIEEAAENENETLPNDDSVFLSVDSAKQ